MVHSKLDKEPTQKARVGVDLANSKNSYEKKRVARYPKKQHNWAPLKILRRGQMPPHAKQTNLYFILML